MSAAAIPPLPECRILTGAYSAGSMESDALAPSSGGVRHCLDSARIWIVRWYQLLPRSLPRYVGSTETSVHKAIRDAERLFQEGITAEGLALLIEVRHDLRVARESNNIEPLMDKWNARYPSELSVDLMLEDVEQLQQYVAAHLRRFAKEAPPDAVFRENVGRKLWAPFEEMRQELGYDSIADMLFDEITAGNLKASLQVKLSAAFQEVLGKQGLPVTVRGRPTISKLVNALVEQYPILKERPWGLIVNPDVNGPHDTLLTEHEFTLIVPTGESGFYWGPANRSIWGMPAVLALLGSMLSPAAGILAAVLGVCGLLYGIVVDEAFWRASERLRRPACQSA